MSRCFLRSLLSLLLVASTRCAGEGLAHDGGMYNVRLDFAPTTILAGSKSRTVFVAGRPSQGSVGGMAISAMREDTGRLISTTTLQGLILPSISLSIPSRGNRVMAIGREDGTGPLIDIFDASSGNKVETVRIAPLHRVIRPSMSFDVGATGVAIDDLTGHAFIAARSSISGQERSDAFMMDAASYRIIKDIRLSSSDVPIDIAEDESTHTIFVIDDGSNRVYTIDARTGRILNVTRVGDNPCGVAVDSAVDRVVIENEAPPSSISVLDARNGRVVKTLPLGISLTMNPPCGIRVDERDDRAFLIGQGAIQDGVPVSNGTITVVDIRSMRIVRTVPVGKGPVAAAIDSSTNHVLVANFGNFRTRSGGSISVLNSRTGAVVKSIAVPGNPAALTVDSRKGKVFVAVDNLPAGPARPVSMATGGVLVLNGV